MIDSMQGNRNPFIDHPELVHYIYGDSAGIAWNPFMDIEGIESLEGGHSMYYPNPVDTELRLVTSFEGKATFTSASGETYRHQSHYVGENVINVSEWPSGAYQLYLENGEQYKVVILH